MLQSCQALFAAEQRALVQGDEKVATDLAYGSHPRQRLDLYSPVGLDGPAPVLVWAHGGGFVRGEKSSPDHPFNAHVGRWAARNGFAGAVMNYRLAPEFGWPSGGVDVGLVVDYLRRNSGDCGIDPDRIVLVGTSAGSVHIATYLQMRGNVQDVRGAVLLSGLYGVTPLEGPDSQYFREGAAGYSLNAIAGSPVPIMVVSAEFDPPRFQTEGLALVNAVLRAKGRLPRAHFASGHNHYTLALHLGSSDERLTDEILSFARDCCA